MLVIDSNLRNEDLNYVSIVLMLKCGKRVGEWRVKGIKEEIRYKILFLDVALPMIVYT